MLPEKKNIIVSKMSLVLLHSESSCKAIYAVVLNLLYCLCCFGEKKMDVQEHTNILSMCFALHIQMVYFYCSRV